MYIFSYLFTNWTFERGRKNHNCNIDWNEDVYCISFIYWNAGDTDNQRSCEYDECNETIIHKRDG